MVLADGADVEAVNDHDTSPLVNAIRGEKPLTTRALLEARANHAFKDNSTEYQVTYL